MSSRRKRRSVVDEAAFRAIHALRLQLRSADHDTARAEASLELALMMVAEG